MDLMKSQTVRKLRLLMRQRRLRRQRTMTGMIHKQISQSTTRTVLTSAVTAIATAAIVGYLSIVMSVEDITIFYRAANFRDVGQAKFAVTFSLANMGRNGALIEQIGLLQVATKGEATGCEDRALLQHTDEVTDRVLSDGGRVTYRTPHEVYFNESSRKALSATIAMLAGTASKVDATFELPAIEDAKMSVMICPVVKYFDLSGRPITAVCPGWLREPGNAGSTNYTTQIGRHSLRLLPHRGSFSNLLFLRFSDRFCTTLR